MAIALAVAAICALLAQWQLGRSVEAPLHDAAANRVAAAAAPTLSKLIQPGEDPAQDAVGTMVKANLTYLTGQVWVVANRVQQDGTPGYWVIAAATDGTGQVVLPLGFTKNLQQAQQARATFASATPVKPFATSARLAPSEAPMEFDGQVLQSLSLGQLANLVSPSQTIAAYPLFLLVTKHQVTGLQDITVTTMTQSQINWLSAFYALEWTLFCGFSVFLWWRLVRDAQIRETEEQASVQG